VDSRVNTHWYFIGVFAGDAGVHIKQVAVTVFDNLFAQPVNGVAKVKVNTVL
jgi:hypothetical protein